MSLDNHLLELGRKHQALGEQVEKLQGQSSYDSFEISALKKKKLHLKDRIFRLKRI